MNFIVINKQANSLYSLIADGQHRATTMSRNVWRILIGSQFSLQFNCNMEGFNVVGAWSSNSKARIGIIGDREINCASCESRIGFGTGGHPDDSNTCGNAAGKQIKAMGYILVK